MGKENELPNLAPEPGGGRGSPLTHTPLKGPRRHLHLQVGDRTLPEAGVWRSVTRAPQAGTFPNQKSERWACLQWVPAPSAPGRRTEVPGSPRSLLGSRVEPLDWGDRKPCQCANWTRPDHERGWAGRTLSHWTHKLTGRASVKEKTISAHLGSSRRQAFSLSGPYCGNS